MLHARTMMPPHIEPHGLEHRLLLVKRRLAQSPQHHGGSFKTMKEAQARRDLIAGEIAAGRNPTDALRALLAPPVPILTVERWAERFLEGRIDIDANTTANYRS